MEAIIRLFRPDTKPELTGEPEVECRCTLIHNLLCTCNATRCYGYNNNNAYRIK